MKLFNLTSSFAELVIVTRSLYTLKSALITLSHHDHYEGIVLLGVYREKRLIFLRPLIYSSKVGYK